MSSKAYAQHRELMSLVRLFSVVLNLVRTERRTKEEIEILTMAIRCFSASSGYDLNDPPRATNKLKGQDLFVYCLHKYGEYMWYAIFASTLPSGRAKHLLKMVDYYYPRTQKENYLPFQNLLRVKKCDLLKMRNLGKKTIAEIETALAVYGLRLEMTEEEIAEIFD